MVASKRYKLVAAGWLIASSVTLYVRVSDLLFLPSWEQSVRAHLTRYPHEIAVIGVSLLIAAVASSALVGSEIAVHGLRWWSWVALVCAFAFAVAIASIGVSISEFPWLGVLTFAGAGVAAAASVAALRKPAETPV